MDGEFAEAGQVFGGAGVADLDVDFAAKDIDVADEGFDFGFVEGLRRGGGGRGLGEAGGYVGHGVTATNLAGRTLADLVLKRPTNLTALPWVNHRSRGWEPEPLRWLGVRGLYTAYKLADRHEAGHRAHTSPIAGLADRITGRP